MWLISNWKSILAVIGTALFAVLLHMVSINMLEAKQRADLVKLANADTKSCNDDKEITERVSHEYEDKISNLNAQLDDLQRVRPNVCITVTSNTAPRNNGTSKPRQSVNQNAKIDSDALYGLAGEGERYRIQLMACQQFVNETWKEQADKQQ